VLDAQQELLNAEVDVASADHDRLVAAFRLKAATERLTFAVFALPV
jgi:outer membrane protein TolC